MTQISITRPLPTGTLTATLTTEHAASSYGIPVLVLEDGTPLGVADEHAGVNAKEFVSGALRDGQLADDAANLARAFLSSIG